MNNRTGEIEVFNHVTAEELNRSGWTPITEEERDRLESIEPQKRFAELKRIRKARVRSEKRRLGRNLTAEEMRAILG